MNAATQEQATSNGAVHPNGIDGGEQQPAVPEFVIEGNGQLSLSPGGKRPTGASLRLVGGRVGMNGEHPKGALLKVTGFIRVTGIEFADTLDRETRQVVGCERRHKATWDVPPLVEVVEP